MNVYHPTLQDLMLTSCSGVRSLSHMNVYQLLQLISLTRFLVMWAQGSQRQPQFLQPDGSPGCHLVLMYEFVVSSSNFQSCAVRKGVCVCVCGGGVHVTSSWC